MAYIYLNSIQPNFQTLRKLYFPRMVVRQWRPWLSSIDNYRTFSASLQTMLYGSYTDSLLLILTVMYATRWILVCHSVEARYQHEYRCLDARRRGTFETLN